ncbi:thioredoxin reductase (NADPH) [Spinactinospora alkalitolerans]|uniref:Thioredoxin reductase (NADPH) n=1 Tax=Spinactinospora alkalitolerans TaxID=687207 RepID=A0A852U2R7_9ACTN|nr:FAD-dependent oxidoreductase [Spinactinospora alkalitolerans]NYE50499.1 thioredoxin reductase (NADPH) [Spinactinospora alkalitolerans]
MEEIVVYGAPWCPDCVRSKRFLATHGVPYSWIDVDRDPAAETRVRELQGGARRIPDVVFPDGSHLVEPSDEELARKLGLVARAERGIYDLIVIGGGPAGLTAGVYAAREDLAVLVVDAGGFGGQATTTQRIDNYPGFPDGIGGPDLVDLFIRHSRSGGVEPLPATRVESLARDGGAVAAELSNGQRITGTAALVATGTTYRRLGVPGEEELVGSGVHFCSTCDGPSYRGRRRLAVIGGGNSACEEALYLAQLVDEVVILQNLGDLTADAVLRERVRRAPNIRVRTGVRVTGFRGGDELEAVMFTGPHGAEEIAPDGVFVFIGLTPNSAFLQGSVELDPHGYVRTDAHHRTSLPAVFAAGDVRTGTAKQLVTAAGDAVAAFLSARKEIEQVRLASVP